MAAVLAVLSLATAPAEAKRPGCASRACEKRVALKHKQRVVRPWDAKLNRMARCESGGRWHIATGNGYFGGLQFSLSTWAAVGGRGMPHYATVLEQKYRAVRLIHRVGLGPWPVCGRA